MNYDAIVIGAGAAGLFCAAAASKRGRRVLVLEHNAQIGRKILISGGGRCNFTNRVVKPENFVSRNPHFCKSALARYTPDDFVELVKKHRIEFYEKKLGQLFCRESARLIVEMLVKECRADRVTIKTNCKINRVEKKVAFEVQTSLGVFSAEKLIVATGGLSFPKIGATDFGYRLAREFGLKIVPTEPSLVPLVFADGSGFGKFAGVSLEADVSIDKISFRDAILFTHRGLSGPAILQISNYYERNKPVSIDFLPNAKDGEMPENNLSSTRRVGNFLGAVLPKSFAEQVFAADLREMPLNRLGKKRALELTESLRNRHVFFNGTEGWHKAEVTRGGVSTDEISSQTMESKKVANLYFIGEVTDVTGWLGGYNFQWAWASGFAAAQSL